MLYTCHINLGLHSKSSLNKCEWYYRIHSKQSNLFGIFLNRIDCFVLFATETFRKMLIVQCQGKKIEHSIGLSELLKYEPTRQNTPSVDSTNRFTSRNFVKDVENMSIVHRVTITNHCRS